MPSDTRRYSALALVGFASAKSRDYASHWLKRQLAKAPANKPFVRLLTDEKLCTARGGHRIYMLDRHTAHRFVMLFPRDWAVPQRLLDQYFFSTESQRADLLLDQFCCAPPPATRTAAGEHVFAVYSAGNGTKIETARSSGLHKVVAGMSATVRHPYELLCTVRCRHAVAVLAVVGSLLQARQAVVAHTRFFDVPDAELARIFRALRMLKRRAEKRPASLASTCPHTAAAASDADSAQRPREDGGGPPAKRARCARAPTDAATGAAGAPVPVQAARA
jgi:hypothetical protein